MAPLAAFAALVWFTRAPLAPESLFYFDSVNYALALDDFNPARHQPQPPGSPFYVLLARLLRPVFLTPERTFLWTGVLASALAAWLLLRLAARLFNERAGYAAAALLLFHPVLWFAGLTNQARAWLAVASTGVALLALRASTREAPASWLYAAGAFAGFMGGFRAEAPVLLAPLLAWAAWKRGASLKQWLGVAAAGAIPSLVWTAWVLEASGGPAAYLQLLRDYSADQFTASSPLFGATWRQTWRMTEVALVFNLLGVLAWIWAAARRRASLGGHGGFLALWFLPAFLFQCTIHVYDPDHALLTVPALCLIGGHFLTSAFPSRRAAAAVTAVACAISAGLFFHPLRGAARPMSYQVVRRVDQSLREAFAVIRAEMARAPVTIVVGKTLVTWRHITYYFPEAEVWVGEWSPSGASAPSREPGRRYIHLGERITVTDNFSGDI
ncbi:MAG: glycosyltransferase family 39 protein [Bryobacteraceae bacterium]|nr:glycosyltransferase family 39 protein [Bryobacteraceae bacterium]